jgi:hypothetical protein
MIRQVVAVVAAGGVMGAPVAAQDAGPVFTAAGFEVVSQWCNTPNSAGVRNCTVRVRPATTSTTTSTTSSTTSTSTTTAASTTTAPPATTTPTVTGRAAPGSVGFLGDPATLRTIDGPLVVHDTNYTLDGVYLRGGIDFYGAGTLTVRNSIIEFGHGGQTTIWGRAAGSTIDVRDSTLRWRPGATPSYDNGHGAIQIVGASLTVIAVGNDISGTGDGIQIAGPNNLIERNWIHGLARSGTYPNNNHVDGVQMYGGTATIRGNYFDVGATQPHTNSCLFFQGSAIDLVVADNNHLSGGGYCYYAENGRHRVTNNDFVSPHLWGTHYFPPPAVREAWSGNTSNGAAI